MSKLVNCNSLPNIPWQEKPAGHTGAPIWRYSENPVIDRNPLPNVARVFNSALVPWNGEYIAVLRGEQKNGIPYIYLGHSKDGLHWEMDEEKIHFVNEKGEPFDPVYAYDPRLVKVEDTYYIRKLSLKANKGCILTNGEIYRKNITIPEEDLGLWFEIEDLGQT